MKKILLVYPHNFLQEKFGTNVRVLKLVKIFKEIGFIIDFFTYDNFFIKYSSFSDWHIQNKDKLIDKLYIYNFKNDKSLKNRIINKIKRYTSNIKHKKYLNNWTNKNTIKYFNSVIKQNNYNIIIMFYAFQAELLKYINSSIKKIYFMEDSVFLQQYFLQNKMFPTLGRLLDEEIAKLKYFDEIFCISYDEKVMYEKFINKNIHFFPHIEDINIKPSSVKEKKWDIMYIGFNNEFNTEGLYWFINNVYPLLNKYIKILFVGSVTKTFKNEFDNIETIAFAPDLEEIYDNTKISICPMLNGTGMKIKVIESIARGIPVVCNERGIDGLPDKTECGCLATQDPDEFANYIITLLTDENFYKNTSEKIINYYNRVFNKKKYIKLLTNVLMK